jgi:transcription elongation factor Elf1
MAVCSNCKKSLSCGCQKRKASNGVLVCTNCISSYEKTVKTLVQPIREANTTSKHISSTPQIWGKDRYTNKK